MIYPMQHRINMSHKYTSAADTDIRVLFAKVRNAATQNKSILDADLVPAGTAKRPESDASSW